MTLLLSTLFSLTLLTTLNGQAAPEPDCRPTAPPEEQLITEKLQAIDNFLFTAEGNEEVAKVNNDSCPPSTPSDENLLKQVYIEVDNKVRSMGSYTKNELLKLIAKKGTGSFKIAKIPSGKLVDGVVDLLLEELDLQNVADHKRIKFDLIYDVEIDPDFENGHIYRHDTLKITPSVTFSNLLKNVTAYSTYGTSYTMTHTRRFLGHKESRRKKFKSDEEYLRPLRKVLAKRPIFFKPMNGQSHLQYLGNIHNNINIPFYYDQLEKFVQSGDQLTYTKTTYLNSGFATSSIDNFVRLGAGVHFARPVSLNLIIYKNQEDDLTYTMKTFLDTSDEFSFEVKAESTLDEYKISGWKPLDKAINRQFRHDLFRARVSYKKSLSFLSIFFLSFDNPTVFGDDPMIKSVSEKGKAAYNTFISQNIYPRLRHLKENFSRIVDFSSHEERSTWLKEQHLRALKPLNLAADYADKNLSDILTYKKILPDTVCTPVSLYPITKVSYSERDLKEASGNLGFTFGVKFLKLFSTGKTRRSSTAFFTFPNPEFNESLPDEVMVDENGVSRNLHYSQSAINLNLFIESLISIQTRENSAIPIPSGTTLLPEVSYHRQAYLLSKAASNKGIEEFLTLGFLYSLENSDFFHQDVSLFQNEISSILPKGPFRDKVNNEVARYKDVNSVYAGYKYLLNTKAFNHLSQYITRKVLSTNLKGKAPFFFVRKVLDQCISKKDPNFSRLEPCNYLNRKEFNDYKNHINLEGDSIHSDESESVERAAAISRISDHLDEIAQKVTLILLNPSEPGDDFATRQKKYLDLVEQMSPSVKNTFYKPKGRLIFKSPSNELRDGSVNNTKVRIFNSLAGARYFDGISNFDSTPETFRQLASSFFVFLLSYSMDGADLKTQTLSQTGLEDFINFEAKITSPQLNQNSEVLRFGYRDPVTRNIILQISNHERNHRERHGNDFACKKESEKLNFVDGF